MLKSELPFLLIVDDDPEIVRVCREHLMVEGYSVLCATSGAEVVGILKNEPVDVVLLDVVLPDANGFDLAPTLKGLMSSRGRGLSILFITALDTPSSRVAGLELGDEYITKPFDLRELSIRLKMLEGKASLSKAIRLEPLVFDVARRRVALNGQPLSLTATEFTLLLRLARTPNIPVPFAELSDLIRPGASVNQQNLMNHISALRGKLSRSPGGVCFLEAIRGVGYVLVYSPQRV